MKLGVVSLAFRCEVVGGEPHTSSESTRVEWVSLSEAIETMPEARAVRVNDALRDDGPFVRIHDGNTLL
jgi:8-oxo-dGTP diphosphatase